MPINMCKLMLQTPKLPVDVASDVATILVVASVLRLVPLLELLSLVLAVVLVEVLLVAHVGVPAAALAVLL